MINLNLKQKKILKLLSINCRFTNKDIAKAVNLSEDSVSYQIDKLINEEKLGTFNTQFVHLNIGYKSHHIWLKLKDRKLSPEIIKKIPNVNSINSSYGKYDYQILVYTKTNKEFKKTIKTIKKEIKPLLLDYSELVEGYKMFTNVLPVIDVPVKIPKNKRKFEYELDGITYSWPKWDSKNKLDNTDKKIIKKLIENPRARFQEIHNETDIPLETIRYRIKGYVQSRLINNFGILHNFQKYDTNLTYFLLKIKDISKKEFSDYLSRNNRIMYSVGLKGKYNCILYVFSQSPEDMFKTYSEVLDFLGNSVIESDLLHFNKVLKYVQFPEKELD